jgi:hypothetical protein
MPQLAFQRVGDQQPWVIEAGATTDVLLTRNPTTINWTTGSPDTIPDHSPVTVYGGTDFLDPDAGMPYSIFTVQGSGLWQAATVNNAVAMDALVGPTTTWGIAFWWDGSGMPVDWQSY